MRLPAFLDNWYRKVAKLSTLCTDHLYPPEDTPGVHFFHRLSRTYEYSAAGRIESMKNTSDLIGNRIRDLQTCNAVPQSTAPLSNRDICSKHKRKIQNLFFYYSPKLNFPYTLCIKINICVFLISFRRHYYSATQFISPSIFVRFNL